MKGAGSLDRRISVERAAITKNDVNEDVSSWSEFLSLWANVTPISDGERYRAAAVGAEATTRFVIRHSIDAATISHVDRISYEGSIYDIHGIKEIGRREGIELTASTRAD